MEKKYPSEVLLDTKCTPGNLAFVKFSIIFCTWAIVAALMVLIIHNTTAVRERFFPLFVLCRILMVKTETELEALVVLLSVVYLFVFFAFFSLIYLRFRLVFIVQNLDISTFLFLCHKDLRSKTFKLKLKKVFIVEFFSCCHTLTQSKEFVRESCSMSERKSG